jgi:hypothetical protein
VIVLPSLMLNYMGQGAMVLSPDVVASDVIKDPFFLMIPDVVRVPVIFLALAATIIRAKRLSLVRSRLRSRRSSWASSRGCRSSTRVLLLQGKSTSP